ncbi:hypothetical protein G8A07_23495 [Roseateles sp. DAIF2]|uniref:YciI family protein n=1 Tax=Roseateles sp. DAIF2 TaxID=2714952 RepID=UPI0018A2648E|nr:hypothetical protein [Roseateles sp. DAIF2]QPF75585.1 hypothetical protein G8A07_23495 [Roseateles sp. DAIF2]
MRTMPHALTALLLALAAGLAPAQEAPPAERLFAVEIRTGAAWDQAKPATAQPHFRAHSEHLARLRAEGRIAMGARYGDKGLLVLRAAGPDEARALMDADPSMQSRTFGYELHEMRVFQPGWVGPAPAKP